jgi:hypothetical protein
MKRSQLSAKADRRIISLVNPNIRGLAEGWRSSGMRCLHRLFPAACGAKNAAVDDDECVPGLQQLPGVKASWGRKMIRESYKILLYKLAIVNGWRVPP